VDIRQDDQNRRPRRRPSSHDPRQNQPFKCAVRIQA
jgi:hypothetical protein